MATRKENIDIEYDEPQQEAVSGSAESNVPYESQDPAEWVPPMTVRIYPISRPRSKLLAIANVNIAKSFAVQGFRIYDSKNGLFVKEPQRSYIKNGTEMTSSVFFPVTKEARDALYSQILNSCELVMEQQERQHLQQKDELEELLEDGDLPFAQPYDGSCWAVRRCVRFPQLVEQLPDRPRVQPVRPLGGPVLQRVPV